MFTDIVGYTSIMEGDDALAYEFNVKHKNAIVDLIPKHDGVVQEIIGDGSLSYFTSASECVQCAVGLQKIFLEEPVVPVRIGIHIGEIRGDSSLVYGNPVNLASRIQSIAIAGSVLLSRNVIDSISGKNLFSFLSVGTYAFKNVEKPIEIYAITGEGLKVPDGELVSGKLKILERTDIIVFDEWDDQELVRRLPVAKLICQQAVCSYGFINYNYSKLRSFIQNGGKFECVMIHPESKALSVSPERQAGAASDIAYVQGQLQLAFHKLRSISSGVTFKITQHLPDPIMTFIDPDSEDGVLFITLTGFQMDLHSRPSFVLRKSTHRKWFMFYYQSFKNMMESEETVEVDFSKEWAEVSSQS